MLFAPEERSAATLAIFLPRMGLFATIITMHYNTPLFFDKQPLLLPHKE